MDALLTYSQTAETCLAAADLCELLAVVFEPPTQELAQGLADGSFASDVLACLEELGAPTDRVAEIAPVLIATEGEASEVLYTLMKQEYSHLFAHPKHPQVWRYETMFKEAAGQSKEPPSLFISPTCLHVEQLMKKAGVSVSADNKQPADFVANELHFASYLFTQCASEEAAAEGEKNTPVSTLGTACAASPKPVNKQKATKGYAVLTDFYEQHLALWLAAFLVQVAEKSTLGVYRAAAQAGLLMLGA